MLKRLPWLLALVVAGCAATAKFNPDDLIEERVDRFTGNRLLVAENLVWGNLAIGVCDLSVAAEPKGAKTVSLVFTKTSDIGLWWWLQNRHVDAIIDGHPTPLGVGEHRSNLKGQTSIEVLLVTVPATTFQRLANASSAEVRVGPKEFEFEPKKLEVLKAFALRAGLN